MKTSAAILAFLVGAMSIVAGAKAIQGWDPGYQVLNWLPIYNFLMGIVTVAVPAVLIWRNSRHAMNSALAVFSTHALVTVLLLTAFRGTVAAESIGAMMFRLAVWVVILALLFFNARKLEKLQQGE